MRLKKSGDDFGDRDRNALPMSPGILSDDSIASVAGANDRGGDAMETRRSGGFGPTKACRRADEEAIPS